MDFIKARINTISSPIKTVAREITPAAIECLKLIPLYWLFCLAPVPVHLTFFMVIASTYIGWCYVEFAVNTIQRVVLYIPSLTQQLNIVAISSTVMKMVNGEEPVRIAFWYIKLLADTVYLIWALWKGRYIIADVRNSCKKDQKRKKTPPPRYHMGQNSPGPMFMVLEAASPVPDDLRTYSNDVFSKDRTMQTREGEDEAEWSSWRKD